MSPPISNAFSKLSIYSKDMQSPRGHKGGAPSSKGKEPMRLDKDDIEEESDISDYETQDSEPEHVLAFYRCCQINPEHNDPEKRRYSFEIADAQIGKEGIQFGSSDNALPRCSCGKQDCRHMLWLLEQLSLAGVDITGDTELGYYEQIASIGLERICENLQWELDERQESKQLTWHLTKGSHQLPRGSRTRVSVQRKIDEIRDILATLSDLPLDDYPTNILDDFENFSADNILVKNDLHATVSRLLILDEALFDQFKNIVPPNVRASDYFYKMGRKAMDAFHRLDLYVENGPEASSTIQHDVIWCAQRLIEIVNAIGSNIKTRRPLNTIARRAAAEALISILTEVVIHRNTDAYQNRNFPRRRPHGEPLRDQVLYQRLIGDPSPHHSLSDNSFVIEHLENLPEARFFIVKLEEVLKHLSGIGWGPAPREYRDRLRGIIAQHKGNLGGPSTPSSMKRPGSSSDRKANKRMK